MARLRDEYDDFLGRGAAVIAICPDGPAAIRRYWHSEHIPFIGLADPQHRVALEYGQEVNLLKLGRMPLLVVLDWDARIRYSHHGESMADIPANSVLLEVIDQLLQERAADAGGSG